MTARNVDSSSSWCRTVTAPFAPHDHSSPPSLPLPPTKERHITHRHHHLQQVGPRCVQHLPHCAAQVSPLDHSPRLDAKRLGHRHKVWVDVCLISCVVPLGLAAAQICVCTVGLQSVWQHSSARLISRACSGVLRVGCVLCVHVCVLVLHGW